MFVERLWRTIKYEEVYLKAYDSVSQAPASIDRYLDFYNQGRPHSALDERTPDEAYYGVGEGCMTVAARFYCHSGRAAPSGRVSKIAKPRIQRTPAGIYSKSAGRCPNNRCQFSLNLKSTIIFKVF